MTALPHPRNIRTFALIAALYITQGIPLGLAMEALPTLLRQDGASLASLALLPLIGLPWILKFLWASMVDNHWTANIGKRKSWILPMQAIVLLCLLSVAAIGMTDTMTSITLMLFAIASLASATQDTATDGLTAENFSGKALAHANAVQVGGTMVGFFIGGSGCLILSGLFGRTVGLLGVAVIVAAGLLLALFWREPAAHDAGQHRPRASLRRFVRRPGAPFILMMALLTAIAAVSPFALFKLFLVDQGWTTHHIGSLGMAGGIATILIGCGGGAWLITRMGAGATMICGLACILLSALIWAMAAGGLMPVTTGLALVAIIAGSIGSGGTSVSLMTFAMRFAQTGDQAGTDMTSVQSSRDCGEMGASSLITMLAASQGYAQAFGLAAIIAGVTAFIAVRWDKLRL